MELKARKNRWGLELYICWPSGNMLLWDICDPEETPAETAALDQAESTLMTSVHDMLRRVNFHKTPKGE